MLEILEFMAAPFAACVILVGIHAYLGLHVLLREVIFVDLALAQIAAFGSVVALVVAHQEPGTLAAYTFSLGATVVGAAIFASTRMRENRVPQEAIIGITFVIASAATILLADRAPEGAEQIKELLAGAILWVSWKKVITVAIVYAVLGVFHYRLRRRFVLISEDPDRAFSQGWNVRLWDFLFYLSFGVVITLSVEMAGVLMVFSFLVAPAIIALAWSKGWPMRILLANAVGVLASALGLFASYQWDLPSGPAIVCVLGLFLILFALSRLTLRRLA
ncbi:MAG: metal ABC transporter permease [Acidobacteriota bacterium]|nr:metal ABC transporter permease [Acidobacteriota bacterium]